MEGKEMEKEGKNGIMAWREKLENGEKRLGPTLTKS